MILDPNKASRRARQGIELERHEAKYFLHPGMIPVIRKFIEPFCEKDPHAPGEIPEYTVTTLQLDSNDFALYRAKEVEALNRFKLRVRTYGRDGRCPVFLEIKRKIKGVIVKSRATIPFKEWSPELVFHPERCGIRFKSSAEQMNYLTFVRLCREIEARPKVLIRYERESYLSRMDNYARVTFDRRLSYAPTKDNEWELLPKHKRWWAVDTQMGLGQDFPSVILELKTYNDCPTWMVDMAERFDLVRNGFSKYFAAVRMESLFSGAEYSDASENVT